MSRFIAALSLVCLLFVGSDRVHAAEQASSISRYRNYSIIWLLTADDPMRVKLGAQWLERDSQYALQLGDFAALPLWEFSQGTRSLDPDTVAWLARALGSSGSRRYLPLLQKVASGSPGKIANYANESISKLTASAPEYDPAGATREQIRNTLSSERDGMPQLDGSLIDLHVGMWIEEVFEKLGYPSDISVVRRSRRVPFAGRIYVDNLLLVFGNKGTVEFDHDRGDWYASVIAPHITLHTGGGTDDDVVQGILSPNVAMFREVARRASQLGASDEATLKAAATRLRSDMKTDDDELADGLAYLCVLIGNSGDASYRDLLAQVSREATRTRLRKHAAVSLEKLSRSAGPSDTTHEPAADTAAP
jgi:hypothetical protein